MTCPSCHGEAFWLGALTVVCASCTPASSLADGDLQATVLRAAAAAGWPAVQVSPALTIAGADGWASWMPRLHVAGAAWLLSRVSA
jgi:hypothetical protein